ncbi:(R,S)-reticuline 7-O-methyltransferase [Ricinus communis]|uniref:O-methyltransferase, putative n=1 Tax=Ricinus communis TaxID=3988 RepID=B9RW39_RICCO|nr:(R,S)-reticuline 7-O-methyltransferase [Ricinus communis]EEF44476.1 o-methyltransferase, putative [Ricinus communis]|eukprot:XP_002517958.1 desmethylxanthohumol 6'-O-methyltransferase [Ricinus communis]
MGSLEPEKLVSGQLEIWKLMFGFADSMVLKAAVELRIPDIINSHARPITLSQIASGIDSSSPDISYLARIMRYLVCKGIFTAHQPSDGGESFYGLAENTRWLLRDSDLTLHPMVIMENHPWQVTPWHYLGQCVKEGGIAFKKAHGCEMWDFASQNPEFNRIFNQALACTAKIVMKAVLSGYKDGFDAITTLVDVGGGTGGNLAEIVKAYPHIKTLNFDLPHVVATAPAFDGIAHVGGNMFESIPNADAIFMKWILHDWGDEYCVKILKNCRKAIPEKTGKLVLVEIVLQEDGNNQFGDMGLVFDLLMFAHTTGGKERSEIEWKKLLEEGGFPRYKIINIPALPSIIEAYPQ